MVESFDGPPLAAGFEIRFDVPMALPNTWFLSEDGVQLVQVQHDRLTLNWRELDHPVTYPRYEALRARFQELLAMLQECVKEAGKKAGITHCEVTYVNPIEHVSPAAVTPTSPRSSTAFAPAHVARICPRLRMRSCKLAGGFQRKNLEEAVHPLAVCTSQHRPRSSLRSTRRST